MIFPKRRGSARRAVKHVLASLITPLILRDDRNWWEANIGEEHRRGFGGENSCSENTLS
jgi:hypothetical protein